MGITMGRFDEELFRASYYHHGHTICKYCNNTIDLSTADNLNEAKQIANEHIESEHR
jgi:Fe2+ or Zn2+ uptake regulation protein